MNNQPVAWRTHYPSGWEYKDGNPPFELKGNSQLLYTHPVKELSRELLDKTIIDQQNEIKDLRKNLDVALMIVNKPKLTDEEITELANEYLCYISHEYEVTGIYKFARAILRKAQEK